MTLSAGTRLGPYELVAPIGAGGMGEVYRAKDTRLDRTVAVKVLPAHLSASAESRQRFEREAKTISQLSHPHICALYDVGREGETEYLVMEYLEGETLSERLLKGALPFDQVLRYGIEIADALDKAHRQGIVHRDLKPGNVMITKSGVKLLDFGLAKAIAPAGKSSGASLTALPTQAGSNLTQEGTILGTFQYMAPEQLEGKEADARTDIFAFGCVLYEMATGQKAFSGKSQASLISSIMGSQPPAISTISPMTPPAFDRVVRTCLAKDPEDRWQNAGDVAKELRWVTDAAAAAYPATIVRVNRRIWSAVAIGLAAGLVVASALGLWLAQRSTPRQSSPLVLRLAVQPPPRVQLAVSMSLSPDGRHLAFVGETAEPSPVGESATSVVLYVRPLDSLQSRPIPDTGLPSFPFWSPDGRSLGFFDQTSQKLKRAELSGGPVHQLCDVADVGGATWSRHGVIVFSPGSHRGLSRVSADGGPVSSVTKLDAAREEIAHLWPSFLPDGRRFLYLARSRRRESTGIYVGSLDSTTPKRLVSADSSAVYAVPGYLLYWHEGGLLAQPFDADRLEVTGEPVRVADGVRIEQDARALFSVSTNGLLAYRGGGRLETELVWFDRQGRPLGTVGSPGQYAEPALSPDGNRLAVSRIDPATQTRDIWLFDLLRGTSSRFTFDRSNDTFPVWSPAGDRILFLSDRGGRARFYVKSSIGGAEEQPLSLDTPEDKILDDWSKDGYIVFETTRTMELPTSRSDLWLLSLSGEHRPPVPLEQTEFTEAGGRISPDGRFLAYVSDESGREEVYVRSFPEPGGKWQVSTDGGFNPSWRADGRELFFVSSNKSLMAAEVESGATFRVGPPRPLFRARVAAWTSARNLYAPSPDGERFLVSTLPEETSTAPIVVIVNWMAALKR